MSALLVEPGRRVTVLVEGIATRRAIAATLLLPALLSLVLYANSLPNGFTYDDFRTIVENPCVKGELPLGELLSRDVWCLSGSDATGSWRPVTGLLMRIVHQSMGLNPFAFHLISLLLYALVTFMAGLLAYRLTHNPAVTLMTGLLFAAHPVHSEAVNSISATSDLLSAFFVLWATVIYAGLRKTPADIWQRGWAIGLFILALLSKETGMTLLGIFLVFDLNLIMNQPKSNLFAQPSKGSAVTHMWTQWLILLLVLAAYFALRYHFFEALTPAIHRADTPLAGQPASVYFSTALTAIAEYLRLLLWPWRLSIDYSFNQIPLVTSLFHPKPIGMLILLLGAFALAVASFRRTPILTLALLFSLITFAPASNLLTPLPTLVAERLLLLPSFGLCLLLGLILVELRRRLHHRQVQVLAVLLILLIASMSWRIMTRNLDWHDNLSLFESAAETTPQSWRVQANLGWFRRVEGDFNQALLAYEKARTISAERDKAFLDRERAICYHGLGEFEQAIELYEQTLARNPQMPVMADLLTFARARRIPDNLADLPR